MNNWEKCEERKQVAIAHTQEMMQKFPNITTQSIANSIIINNPQEFMQAMKYPQAGAIPEGYYAMIMDAGCVEALFTLKEGPMALLDFASYKSPGGKFMEGAMAQEEAICHASNLYNILSDQKFNTGFYLPNNNNLNKALYHDNMIIAKDVVFSSPDRNRFSFNRMADVIVAAAPNAKAAMQYCYVPESIINQVIYQRVYAVMNIIAAAGYKSVILGAFGCGVFGCNPEVVATAFKTWFTMCPHGSIEYVIYAIPHGPNFDAFKRVMNL